jgi:Protein of unknown function (DUF3892)
VLYITAVRLSGGDAERHIAFVRWLNAATGLSKTSSVVAMVNWLEKGNRAYVGGNTGRAEVQVVRSAGQAPYLRSQENGQWTDNLLRLPRY